MTGKPQSLRWTPEQLEQFQADPLIDEASLLADRVMRPMAEVYCRDVLDLHDAEYNSEPDPLGPNWHIFAAELERAIIRAQEEAKMSRFVGYLTFVNWALNEPTSYLGNEAVLTPIAGLSINLPPTSWMKYFPMPNIESAMSYADSYLDASVRIGLRKERDRLRGVESEHHAHWAPLHTSFAHTAETLGIPYVSLA